ncbi:hypothetical protein JW948_18425 [bacterium]|nr:hypothetical protein [bacterium]
MINPYKRLDVFRCSQDAHHGFQGRVSVYHVLKEKKCFPEGCLYFIWRCSRMEKGEPCIHKYNYIGKNCRGCTYYIEDKVHLQPECLLAEPEYEAFLESLEQYDAWLENNRFRRLAVAGRIRIVKPWFERIIYPRENHTKLLGYLLVFRKGYIGMQAFDDTFYVRISDPVQKAHRFVPKMKVEFEGELRENRGRIVFHKPGKFEFLTRGWGNPWKKDRALVAVRTATLLKEQPDMCLNCPWGALTDVSDKREEPVRFYRNLYCLKGMADPEVCYVRLRKR